MQSIVASRLQPHAFLCEPPQLDIPADSRILAGRFADFFAFDPPGITIEDFQEFPFSS
jgi:hypothetical protein